MEDLQEKDFDATLEKDKFSVVYFYADWCMPCKKFMPIAEKVLESMSDVLSWHTAKIEDVEKQSTIYQISSVPTSLIFKYGKPIASKSGRYEENVYKTWILNTIKQNDNDS